MKSKNKRTVVVTLEASKTGFGAYSDELPGVSGYGKTVADAKMDLQEAIAELLEGPSPDSSLNDGDLDFTYKFDLKSVFQHFGTLNLTNLSERIGLNASLLRQYKNGIVHASEKAKAAHQKRTS